MRLSRLPLFRTSAIDARITQAERRRLDGNGGDYWVFFEYGTQNRLTGGGVTFEGERYQTTLTPPQLADGTVHTWSLTYDSNGANGDGEITFVMDGTLYRSLTTRPQSRQCRL